MTEQDDARTFNCYLRAWGDGRLADRAARLLVAGSVHELARLVLEHPPTVRLDVVAGTHVCQALESACARYGVRLPAGWHAPPCSTPECTGTDTERTWPGGRYYCLRCLARFYRSLVPGEQVWWPAWALEQKAAGWPMLEKTR